MTILKGIAIGLALLAVSCAILVFLASRLPPGLARDLAAFLPSCLTLLRRLRGDPRLLLRLIGTRAQEPR